MEERQEKNRVGEEGKEERLIKDAPHGDAGKMYFHLNANIFRNFLFYWMLFLINTLLFLHFYEYRDAGRRSGSENLRKETGYATILELWSVVEAGYEAKIVPCVNHFRLLPLETLWRIGGEKLDSINVLFR